MTAQSSPLMLRTNKPYHNAYQAELDKPDAPATPPATQDQNPLTANSELGPELTPEERTYKTRYDSLKTHYDKTIIDMRKRMVELEGQVTKTGRKFEIPANPEEFKAWKAQYPDLYRMIVGAVREEVDTTSKDMEKKMEHLENLAKSERRKAAEATLLRLHPDFEELRASENFHNWVKDQPAPIQAWLYDNEDDPLLASKAIDLYKAETGVSKRQSKKPDLASAANAVTKTAKNNDPELPQGKVWKVSEIKKLNRRDFDKYEAEIELAREQGRLDFDI